MKKLSKNNQSDKSKFIVRRGIPYKIFLSHIFRISATCAKAELLQECIFFLIHLFARDVIVMKKLEIEKTKPTFIMSVLKVGLNFFDFQLF